MASYLLSPGGHSCGLVARAAVDADGIKTRTLVFFDTAQNAYENLVLPLVEMGQDMEDKDKWDHYMRYGDLVKRSPDAVGEGDIGDGPGEMGAGVDKRRRYDKVHYMMPVGFYGPAPEKRDIDL